MAINRSPRWGWGEAGAANLRLGVTRKAVGGGRRAESGRRPCLSPSDPC